jgi:hypothetical protein
MECNFMQFAKDSFSVALRERLAGLNPLRTVVVSGAQRPAVVVQENELPSSGAQLSECFYLEWGPAQPLAKTQAEAPIYQMECTISYFTEGTVESGVDRGRVLGELDRELLMICQPASTGKRDFSQSPSADLGTGVSWTLPSMADPKIAPDSPASGNERMTRIAKITAFFFPEVGAL